jgi:ketosteroid isomerase-like protein
MSQSNVEVVAAAYEAFNRGGFDAVPSIMAEFFDPDVVFVEPPEQPGATTFRGLEAVIDGFRRSWGDMWQAQRSTTERIVDAGDRVVVLSRERLRGRDGVEVERRGGGVFTLKDGKIIRFEAFWDQERALRAAGVHE